MVLYETSSQSSKCKKCRVVPRLPLLPDHPKKCFPVFLILLKIFSQYSINTPRHSTQLLCFLSLFISPENHGRPSEVIFNYNTWTLHESYRFELPLLSMSLFIFMFAKDSIGKKQHPIYTFPALPRIIYCLAASCRRLSVFSDKHF